MQNFKIYIDTFVAGILQKSNIKPFKIKYYLEKRDAQFDEKMHNILVVYKQIELNFDGDYQVQSADISKINYVSYDEKPGIQTISCTAPDKTPTQEHGFISRDSEYIRHGTISLLAGMDFAQGDAVIVMDADLQDPPELIPKMIDWWEKVYKDVCLKRKSRNGETWLKKWTSHMCYKLLQRMTDIPIQPDVGDFRLLDRQCINALKTIRETQRYTKGLFS